MPLFKKMKNPITSISGGSVGLTIIVEALTTDPINWLHLIQGVGIIILGLFAEDKPIKKKININEQAN